MTLTITPGFWIIPALITLIVFAWAIRETRGSSRSYGYGALGDGMVALVCYGLATVAASLVWLVWALIALFTGVR